MSTPSGLYRQCLQRRSIAPDPSQQRVIEELERLYRDLAKPPARGWHRRLHRLTGGPLTPPTGVYLWGGVGRGKTFLMDLFYDALSFEDKLRQHFHRFMNSIHANLKEVQDQRNPLQLTADVLAKQTRVICFDELFVTDIADAMILGNLFSALFDRGVALVATSNVKPENLYREGLQRQRFLPAIELIQAHTRVVHVDGELDYRLRVLERADVYQRPTGEAADRKLADYFEAIAPDEGDRATSIDVLGRIIKARRVADGVIWFDFFEICDGPRSHTDYIELSRCYQTVLISDIPQLDMTLEDQARRFIALVDEFYDRRVKLMVSANVPLHALYAGKRLSLEFKRTTSRLEEMQSYDYLASPHIP